MHRFDSKLISTFGEFPKRGSFRLFGFNSSNVWNDWNPGTFGTGFGV
jgi:hypothetical protein